MKKITIKNTLYFYMFVASVIIFSNCSCERKSEDTSTTENISKNAIVLQDKEISGFQRELLKLAMEAASKIPVDPHIKDRSRAQEQVIGTCLKLDQAQQALEYAQRIDSWRRGYCYAEVAYYCVQHDKREYVSDLLETAEKIAKQDHSQQWRSDIIQAKIEQTQTLLKQTRQDNIPAEDADLQMGNTEKNRITVTVDDNTFNKWIKILDDLIAQDDLDITRNALNTYSKYFNRFYTDEQRRVLIENKIKSSWGKLPVIIKIDVLRDLAGHALEHNDQNKALQLVNETQVLLDSNNWALEDYIPQSAKIFELRFRAGDKEKARSDADALRTRFEEQRDKILNVERAGALRPLAQAYQTMGNTEVALSVYKQAVEEGVENPNSRPRAEDLSATCCSMALYKIEPDDELWKRLRQISEELEHPW